jgi:hypothetical protein
MEKLQLNVNLDLASQFVHDELQISFFSILQGL